MAARNYILIATSIILIIFILVVPITSDARYLDLNSGNVMIVKSVLGVPYSTTYQNNLRWLITAKGDSGKTHWVLASRQNFRMYGNRLAPDYYSGNSYANSYIWSRDVYKNEEELNVILQNIESATEEEILPLESKIWDLKIKSRAPN